jgi:selenocysteine lyase/cysteine desulfurase
MNESHKSLFVPSQGIYLLNHSVGRPPVTTRDAWVESFLEPWENAGENVWPRWLETIDNFRNAIAVLLNGHAADFCPQVNLSSALTKIISSLTPTDSRRTILYTEEDFPSIAFVLQQAVKQGYRIKAIPGQLDTLDPEVWSEQLSGDVCLVLVTHVQSNTGRQVPVTDICAMAQQREIVSVIDVAQSVGVVPIDLCVWKADFIIGSCVKWLCGGPGAGFLWVAPHRLSTCEPTDVGWFSHENPFEFDIHNFRYAKDALRFWGGTPSVAPYATAANSIRLIHQIGVDTIRTHNLSLTRQIIEAVDVNCMITPAQPKQRGGTVVLHYPEEQLDALCSRLKRARVDFDVRPTGIRMSPHIYNDLSEIEAVVDLL